MPGESRPLDYHRTPPRARFLRTLAIAATVAALILLARALWPHVDRWLAWNEAWSSAVRQPLARGEPVVAGQLGLRPIGTWYFGPRQNDTGTHLVAVGDGVWRVYHADRRVTEGTFSPPADMQVKISADADPQSPASFHIEYAGAAGERSGALIGWLQDSTYPEDQRLRFQVAPAPTTLP